ncbi:DUF2513 domain-containing protein [Pontitalea aquivivens]|uniref:DUF2513 domain-containing protein n=1 Tax=Pontitalea aquivivens TaxID=3388663 RepID=UPI0039705B4D
MKRDDDFIRTLLLRFEADQDWLQLMTGDTSGASRDELRERYHVLLMMDQGLMAPVGRSTMRMTAAGHDFLDAIRDQGIWSKTKEAVAETGGNASLEILKSLALGLLKKKISQHTGIDL